MPRLRPSLTRLLALLLLAQWAAAFAHCFAPFAAASGTHSVEICTADGLRAVLVGEDGQPAAPEPAALHPTCPACAGPAALEPPPPAAARPVVWAYAAPARPSQGLPVAPARAPPQQPRAPPTA